MFVKFLRNSASVAVFCCGSLLASSAAATGVMSCDSGSSDTWQTQDDLKAKLEAEGWQVRKTKIDEGCYEVYGTTPEGQRVEAYFDPVTFEKLLVARRGEILYRKEDG